MVVSINVLIYVNNTPIITTMTSHIDVVAFDCRRGITNVASYVDVFHAYIKYCNA